MGSLAVTLWLALAGILAQFGPQPAANVAWPALRPVSSEVAAQDGRATFLVDGRPYFPLGVTYHFTRHRPTWEYDLSLMHKLGLNTVRADLGWRDVEAVWEGHYRFTLLDEFLAAAARHRLRVVLLLSYATSDTDIPWWYWLRDGREDLARIRGGSLLDARPSINGPNYRRAMAGYIAATVAHVKDHPAILAYQVLNEPRYVERPAIHQNPHTIRAFHSWLEAHYGTIDNLNMAWHSGYRDFSAVRPPVGYDGVPAPDLPQGVEDWHRFSYENLAEFVDELAQTVREQDPRHAILVAEMSWWWWGEQPETGVSPWHIYRAADVVGFDVYPETASDSHYYALNADMLVRYWGKPVWVMELNRKDGRPEPEEIRRFAEEAVDYGARGVFYFSWRDHRLDGGDYGLLDRWGRPKPQLAAYGKTVSWLRDRADTLLGGLAQQPDVYLVWPTQAVSRATGRASPSWQVYDLAAKLRSEGLRVGLVDEASAGQLPANAEVVRVPD